MNLNLLLMVPPLALFVMRGGWMETAIVLGAMAFIAYRDWIDNSSHAIKALGQRVDALSIRIEQADKDARDVAALTTQVSGGLTMKIKALEEVVDGHTRALQASAAKHKSIL